MAINPDVINKFLYNYHPNPDKVEQIPPAPADFIDRPPSAMETHIKWEDEFFNFDSTGKLEELGSTAQEARQEIQAFVDSGLTNLFATAAALAEPIPLNQGTPPQESESGLPAIRIFKADQQVGLLPKITTNSFWPSMPKFRALNALSSPGNYRRQLAKLQNNTEIALRQTSAVRKEAIDTLSHQIETENRAWRSLHQQAIQPPIITPLSIKPFRDKNTT